MKLADRDLSSAELESGNVPGGFLQTPVPVLENVSGPMVAQVLSSIGLGSGIIGRAQILSVPSPDKIGLPEIAWEKLFCLQLEFFFAYRPCPSLLFWISVLLLLARISLFFVSFS